MRSKSTLDKSLLNTVALLLDEKIIIAKRFAGGINSHVYQVTTVHNHFLLKKYFPQFDDTKSRLEIEYYGLQFLWNNMLRMIPQPILIDKKNQIGVYRLIDGRKLKSQEISINDIDQSVQFIRKLFLLSRMAKASLQPTAKDACFSLNAYIINIDQRLGKLSLIQTKSGELEKFLNCEFKPFYYKIKQTVIAKTRQIKYDPDQKLTAHEKILSPSDVGFHNILKTKGGKLYFIDFEYYGWDDPAKIICDFYLQPDVPLPVEFRRIFFEKVCRYLGKNLSLTKRLLLIYPLLSLKWCLIMLNIFMTKKTSFQKNQQLAKAVNQLRKAKSEYRESVFPLNLDL